VVFSVLNSVIFLQSLGFIFFLHREVVFGKRISSERWQPQEYCTMAQTEIRNLIINTGFHFSSTSNFRVLMAGDMANLKDQLRA
jgi:hypothetical protein